MLVEDSRRTAPVERRRGTSDPVRMVADPPPSLSTEGLEEGSNPPKTSDALIPAGGSSDGPLEDTPLDSR